MVDAEEAEESIMSASMPELSEESRARFGISRSMSTGEAPGTPTVDVAMRTCVAGAVVSCVHGGSAGPLALARARSTRTGTAGSVAVVSPPLSSKYTSRSASMPASPRESNPPIAPSRAGEPPTTADASGSGSNTVSAPRSCMISVITASIPLRADGSCRRTGFGFGMPGPLSSGSALARFRARASEQRRSFSADSASFASDSSCTSRSSSRMRRRYGSSSRAASPWAAAAASGLADGGVDGAPRSLSSPIELVSAADGVGLPPPAPPIAPPAGEGSSSARDARWWRRPNRGILRSFSGCARENVTPSAASAVCQKSHEQLSSCAPRDPLRYAKPYAFSVRRSDSHLPSLAPASRFTAARNAAGSYTVNSLSPRQQHVGNCAGSASSSPIPSPIAASASSTALRAGMYPDAASDAAADASRRRFVAIVASKDPRLSTTTPP
mmetsp:Transcript_17168/g.60281  ORF Transcript_17168/g.60281 Transcript_17168/m.60281 type:complete len:441 (+) Transcript_17168:1481-2803(+)